VDRALLSLVCMTIRSRSLRSITLTSLVAALAACDSTVALDGDVSDEDLADDPGAGEGEIPTEAIARPDLVSGALAVSGAAETIVPPAGEVVLAEALLEDGSAELLVLETDGEGRVWEYQPVEHSIDQPVPLALGACSDGAHSFLPWRWSSTFKWKFYAASTPSYLSAAAVEGALRNATDAVTHSRNDCGLADQVGARHQYLGRSSSPVSSGGPCGGRNGVSNVGFGDLRPGVLAVTCTYSSGGRAVESDLRFNRAFRWYTREPSGCSRAWSIAGVAVHERGHTFGLGHVTPQATHASLTMSPAIAPCTKADATLGLGDVRGLRRKY
jgi:hypothetical protein